MRSSEQAGARPRKDNHLLAFPPQEEGIDLSTLTRERALRLVQMLALENAERMNDESLPSGIRYAAAVLRQDCLELLQHLANVRALEAGPYRPALFARAGRVLAGTKPLDCSNYSLLKQDFCGMHAALRGLSRKPSRSIMYSLPSAHAVAKLAANKAWLKYAEALQTRNGAAVERARRRWQVAQRRLYRTTSSP